MNKIDEINNSPLPTTEFLLPCPFCGKKPQWVHKVHPSGVPGIQCDECQFLMKQDRKDKTMFFWNRRAAMDLQLPVLFTEWKDDKCVLCERGLWRVFKGNPPITFTLNELYTYWLQNIYQP